MKTTTLKEGRGRDDFDEDIEREEDEDDYGNDDLEREDGKER